MSEIFNWNGLANELKEIVVGKLDLKNRCSLRACSKLDKSLVDDVPHSFDFIRIQRDVENAENLQIVVSQSDYSKIMWIETANSTQVINTFLRLIAHPKSTVKEILFIFPNSTETFVGKLEETLLDVQFKAQQLCWNCHEIFGENFLKIFKRFDSKFLKRLYLPKNLPKEQMLQIVKLDQWKSLSELSMGKYKIGDPVKFTVPSVSSILHMNQLQLGVKQLDVMSIMEIITNFIEQPRPIGSFFTIERKGNLKNQDIYQHLKSRPPPVTSFKAPSGNFHEVYATSNPEGFLVLSIREFVIKGIICLERDYSNWLNIKSWFTDEDEHFNGMKLPRRDEGAFDPTDRIL